MSDADDRTAARARANARPGPEGREGAFAGSRCAAAQLAADHDRATREIATLDASLARAFPVERYRRG